MEAKVITTEEDLKTALEIRRTVFVEEQGFPLEEAFDDLDTLNDTSFHILVYYENIPVGTGRITAVGETGKIERICILKPYRKFVLGKIIINSLEKIANDKGLSKVTLQGQKQAEGFYHKLGYQTVSDVFIRANIPHVLMEKELHK